MVMTLQLNDEKGNTTSRINSAKTAIDGGFYCVAGSTGANGIDRARRGEWATFAVE
jgi:hypothetical protein